MKCGTRTLMVVRQPNRKGRTPSEWLRGSVHVSEVAEEAQALLDDPRDTITRVLVWNDRAAQFDATVYR